MLKSLTWNDYLLILAMLPVPKKAVKIKKIWSVSRITQRPQPKMSQTCQQRKRRPAWQYYVEQEQQHSSDKLSFVYPWWLQTNMLLLSALWCVLLKHRHMNAGQTKRLAFHMQSQILKKKKKKNIFVSSGKEITVESWNQKCQFWFMQSHMLSTVVLIWQGCRKDTKKKALRRSSIWRCLLDSSIPFLSSFKGLCLKLTTTSAWEEKNKQTTSSVWYLIYNCI